MTIEFTEEERIRPTDGGTDSQTFGGAKHQINATATKEASKRPYTAPTFHSILQKHTDEYLASLDPSAPPLPIEVESTLLSITNSELKVENAGRFGSEKFVILKSLHHVQVAKILVQLHRVVRLVASSSSDAMQSDTDALAIYDPAHGIYSVSNDAFRAVIARYSSGGAIFVKDVFDALRVFAPSLHQESSGDWAAVANGDYHHPTHSLHPFSPERVFLSRGPVDYLPAAVSPTIHNDEDDTDWEFDSWLREVADGDEGTHQLLWEMFSAVVKPKIRTKAVALVNPVGNNGKGTILQVGRELAGEGNTLSASIASLSKDTTLPLLAGKSLVISDENATNDFVKNAETIKILATADVFLVNPKYRQPYNARFEGTQIHCLNALPRFGDHTDSMWRRWLFIPLTAEFEGRERKYIKDDYIRRPEVLQYVLKRALEMDFNGFSETDATRELLKDAKRLNDAARQFWNEHDCIFVWDLLPLEFLYDLFKGWFERNKPGGRVVDRATFDESIRSAVRDAAGDWKDHGQSNPMKASVRMSGAEPLVDEYDLDTKWRHVDKKKQYRNVIFRDRVTLAITRPEPTPASEFASKTPQLAAVRDIDNTSALTELESLVAQNVAAWKQRAVDDDGVTDPIHVHDHAMIRRMGSSCACRFGPQSRYDRSLVERAQELDLALFTLRAELKGEAA